MHARRFSGMPAVLDSPQRTALLEVERVVDLCLATFPAQSVLDVGTGTGLFAKGFAARGLKVTGIDVNPNMIEAARRQVPEGRFRQAPAEAIPCGDGSFDLAFLGLVLHETDDRQQALREAGRVARLGAAVLEWPFRQARHGPPQAHRLKPADIMALAQTVGFARVETLPLSHLVLYRLVLGPTQRKERNEHSHRC
jgi:ubiquinone/menaquinone biosynthesis C-methylase UbiE